MPFPDDLREYLDEVASTSYKNFGPRIEAGRRREIYWLKLVERAGVSNTVRIGELATGGTLSKKDLWGLVAGDVIVWPDSLEKDALPLYAVQAGLSSVKYVRVSVTATPVAIRMLYRDIP